MELGETATVGERGAAAAAPVPLPDETLAQIKAASQQMASVLGAAVAMLMRSPHWRHTSYRLTN